MLLCVSCGRDLFFYAVILVGGAISYIILLGFFVCFLFCFFCLFVVVFLFWVFCGFWGGGGEG